MDVSLVETEVPAPAPDTCRVCGCTDHDCSQCVERTGAPCYWVIPGVLCSACATIEQLLERSLELVRAGVSYADIVRLPVLATARLSAGIVNPDEVCMACYAGVAVGHWLHDCTDESPAEAEVEEEEPDNSPAAALGLRHALNHQGECAHWCRACEANERAGLNQSGPMLRAGDDGFRLWRSLAELIGDPALAFNPELLVSRVAERFAVLEACKMPPDPELGGLVLAAAGLPVQVVAAMRELAEAAEQIDFRFPSLRTLEQASVRFAETLREWLSVSMMRSAYEIAVDNPTWITRLLSVAGYGQGVEVVAAWTTDERRAVLEWLLIGRHREPPLPAPSFLDQQSARGDA